MKDIVKVLEQFDVSAIIEKCKDMEQAPTTVTHEFADGLYVRRLVVPPGVFAIGKIHRFNTYNVFLRGKILLCPGQGEEVVEVSAPLAYTSEAGTRKIAYILEECEWICMHPTLETDIEKIEDFFITKEEVVEIEGEL